MVGWSLPNVTPLFPRLSFSDNQALSEERQHARGLNSGGLGKSVLLMPLLSKSCHRSINTDVRSYLSDSVELIEA
jgi:hypothetical protein